MYVNKQLREQKSEMSWAYVTFMQTYWLDRCWTGVPDSAWLSSLSPERQRAYDRAGFYGGTKKSAPTSEQSAQYEAAYRKWIKSGKTTAAALEISEALR